MTKHIPPTCERQGLFEKFLKNPQITQSARKGDPRKREMSPIISGHSPRAGLHRFLGEPQRPAPIPSGTPKPAPILSGNAKIFYSLLINCSTAQLLYFLPDLSGGCKVPRFLSGSPKTTLFGTTACVDTKPSKDSHSFADVHVRADPDFGKL
jgi:hypothetical protein